MKNLFITSFLLIASLFPAHAQMKEVSNLEPFNKRLMSEAQQLESIESDFVQEKYLDIFDEKILSKGKFYYKKENRICMEYSEPMSYLIVINGNKLKIVSDGKTSITNLGSNKMMNQVQDMLTACMVGDLSKLSDNYKLSYYEDDRYYRVEIQPVERSVRAYIAQIEIHLDKRDMSVYKLRLNETESNYTEYTFRNKKTNGLIDEKIFDIR